MFIFQLMGGIGNQMFQYAAAKALSVKRGIPFKIHFEDPYKESVRRYNLDVFTLKIEHASNKELRKIRPSIGLKRKVHKLFHFQEKKHFVSEQNYFLFDKSLFTCPSNSYVYGFWQTEKYFNEVAELVRKDFTFKDSATGKNKILLDKIIDDTQAVSLHIRRGDYVSVEKTNKIHGICSMDYYEKAIALVVSKINQPIFYIFSDDMQWVKNNFKIPYSTVCVDVNGDTTNYEDLRLMSKCKHHIIANSSFSWWGAWLNYNTSKIVIAPQKWANIEGLDTSDLIPETWVRL